MARNRRAALHSVRILSNNLDLLLADDIGSELRDQISWYRKQTGTMFWFLLVYCSEDDNVLAASASSNDEMSKVFGLIWDFAVESGDVMVDAFEIMAKQQLHTTSKNSTTTTTTAEEDEDEDEEPLLQLACKYNPAAAFGLGVDELAKSVFSLIIKYIHFDQFCRILLKENARQSIGIPRTQAQVVDGVADATGIMLYAHLMFDRLAITKGTKQQLNVIAITGEGGTGKTTLARMLYHAFKSITFCGWLSVSKTYVMRDLLLSLLNDIMGINETIHEMDERELKNQLWKQLKGRLYVIVIDDVWDTHAWDELKDLFPDDDDTDSSRVLITTRSPEVASYATRPGKRSFTLPQDLFKIDVPERVNWGDHYDGDAEEIFECYCFELKPLNHDASWVLFCDLYFRKACCPGDHQELEAHGRRIVRSCCGRPLVISVVAHILRAIDGDEYRSSWSIIAGQINEELTGDLDQQMDILALCFHMLPQTLQSCFLYLGIFPEDREISVKQLIQLWVAEGLIVVQEDDASLTMEDVAEYHLQELIELRLILISKTTINGEAKSCRIHDILRDFCIHLSKEGLLEVHTGGDHSSISTAATDHQTRSKKLSILGNCREYLSNSVNPYSHPAGSCSYVRSFSSFSQDTQSFSKEDWKLFFQHFQLLRVLNVGNHEARNKLDDSIKNLIHLRYLKVKPAKNITLPMSAIFNLWNLQTIDLRQASFSKLPVDIWKMRRLRHLYLGGRSRLPKAGIEDHLPNLLTLTYISNDPRGNIRIAEKAPNLRKLGLNGYRCASKEDQKATFNLQNLQSLKFAEECTFKERITLPATITKITVKGALLQLDAIKMFGNLPNLQILKLQTNFDNDKLEVLGEEPFPELQVLQLANSNIVTWILDKRAMPKLKQLVLSNCSQLPKLPDELWDMSTLQKLQLAWCSEELVDNLPRFLKGKEGFHLAIYPEIRRFLENCKEKSNSEPPTP